MPRGIIFIFSGQGGIPLPLSLRRAPLLLQSLGHLKRKAVCVLDVPFESLLHLLTITIYDLLEGRKL